MNGWMDSHAFIELTSLITIMYDKIRYLSSEREYEMGITLAE